jgi:hypothetical protein
MKLKIRTDVPFGLTTKWRIDWELPQNNLAVIYSKCGFHAKKIGKLTGLSIGQVYYRNRLHGIRIRDYRDGIGKAATRVIKKYTIRTVKGTSL